MDKYTYEKTADYCFKTNDVLTKLRRSQLIL